MDQQDVIRSSGEAECRPGFDATSALALARSAHAGQVDKAGRDYLEAHLLPIGDSLREHGDLAVAAGYLHDILEDTPHTAASLREAGVPEQVIAAVEAVTRRAGEPYSAMISRARLNPLGRLVKLADNAHNLAGNEDLALLDPETAARLKVRYERARMDLLSTEDWPLMQDVCPYCDSNELVTVEQGMPVRCECGYCGTAWIRSMDGSPELPSADAIFRFAQAGSWQDVEDWVGRILAPEIPVTIAADGQQLVVGFGEVIETVEFPSSLDTLWGLLAELLAVARVREPHA